MDNTALGMQTLESWVREDPTRRYSIEWLGPVMHINANGWRGGWKVCAWSARFPKRKLLYYLGDSLSVAVRKALARYRMPAHA